MNIFQWLRFKFTRKYFDGENDLEVKKSKIGKTITYTFMLGDKIHRKDGPAFIFRFNNSYCLIYLQYGQIHRLEGPAFIVKHDNGNYLCYIQFNKIHRLEGPACIKNYGDQVNHIEHKIFRDTILHYTSNDVNDGDYFYQNARFDPEELGFEMPIDTTEKDTYMKLTFT